MLRLQLIKQLKSQRFRSDTRGVGHGSVDGGEGTRGEGESGALGNWTEEIAAASQDT